MNISITSEELALTYRFIELILILLIGFQTIRYGYNLLIKFPLTYVDVDKKKDSFRLRNVPFPILLMVVGAWILIHATTTRLEITTTNDSGSTKQIFFFEKDNNIAMHTIATLNTTLKLINIDLASSEAKQLVGDIKWGKVLIENDKKALIRQMVGDNDWKVWEKYGEQFSQGNVDGISDSNKKILDGIQECFRKDLANFRPQ